MDNSLLQKRVSKILSSRFVSQRIAMWEIDGWNRIAINFMRKSGIEPDAILSFRAGDNLRKAWGINVFHPVDYINKNRRDMVLCISLFEYNIHKKFLYDMNLSQGRIFVDYKKKFRISEKIIRYTQLYFIKIKNQVKYLFSLTRHIVELWKGFIIYKKLVYRYGEIPFFFFNYTGTGDVFLGSLILHKYLEDNKISNYVILVDGKGCFKVAELFNYPKVHELCGKDRTKLTQFIYFVGTDNTNIKLMVQLYNHLDISLRLAATKLNLFDVFLYRIMRFDQRPEIVYPVIDCDENSIIDIFEKNSLRKGRTIIISPYSNSEVSASPGFWNKLVSVLILEGYDIVTMCHGAERPIKGTQMVDFSFKYAKGVLEYAGYFIGVRSGFCDLIINAECKKIIFYFENIYGNHFWFYKQVMSHINNRNIYEWASLEKMGLTNQVLEIRCFYHCNQKIINIISNYLREEY